MKSNTTWTHVSALVLVLLLGFGAAQAWAQSGTTSIYGEVIDAQGAAVAGAKVIVTNSATGARRETETDSTGKYIFPSLAPGIYKMRVEMTGFRAAVRERIELLVDTRTKHNVALEVGALSETVVVSEAAAALNTTDASVGNAFGERPIKELPLEGRNVSHLLSLQPGVVYVPNASGFDPRSGSVAGSRADQTNITLDGVDVNDAQFSTAFTPVLRTTLDSTQEFRVTTTNYGADQGRSSAAQISLVTKSGTNELHGSAYWYHRNTVTSTNPYYSGLAGNDTPFLNKHIFGGAVGGPLLKDRFFGFFNFERNRLASGFPVSRAVPSASFRDGVLIYRCANVALCPATTVAGVTGMHAVPVGSHGLTPAELAGLDPIGVGASAAVMSYMQSFPLPNTPGRDVVNFAGFDFNSPILEDQYTYITRLDYRLDSTGNHTLFARGTLQDDTFGGTSQFPGQPPNTKTLFDSKGYSIGYNAVLSRRWVNVFRYGFTRFDVESSGLRNSNLVTLRFLSTPTGQTSSTGRTIPTHNIVDDISYTRGNHSFQFGTNLRFSRIPSYSNAGSFHTAVANGSWTSGVGRTFQPGGICPQPNPAVCLALPAVSSAGQAGFADGFIDILGVISQASARYNYDRQGNVIPTGTPNLRNYGSNEYELYVQDSWRWRPNVTVTLGVRYGSYSPPWETTGLQVAPEISLGEWIRQRGINAANGIPQNAQGIFSIDLSGPENNGKGFYAWDKNNFAPSASVAWSPQFNEGMLGWFTGRGKMVIRGGYRMVFDRIGQALASQFDAVGSFGLSTSLSSPFGVNNEDNPLIRFVDQLTLPPTLPAAPPGGFPQTPPSFAGVITSSIDDEITTPYSHVYNIGIGRELPWGLNVEANYQARRGRDLLTRRDLAMYSNLVDPASGMDYFRAASLAVLAAAGIPASAARPAYAGIAAIPYWENLFPAANLGLGLTATQEVARRFNRDAPDHTTSIWLMDQFCFPACSIFGPFAYFNEQYDSLAGQSSIGSSEYHALQVTLRRRATRGLQFDLNYTMSKSNDLASAVERGSFFTAFGAGGYSGFLLNSWEPKRHWGASDFDVRQQVNLNWVYDLPFGRGQAWGSDVPGFLNQIIGGWQVSGLWRMTSGFPFSIQNCRSCWPTNWNLQGNAELVTPGVLPPLGTTRNAVQGRPSPFRDAANAESFFRRGLPGEVGLRNVLRGDGYFVIDLGVQKSWTMPWKESHKLKFRWETFNLTNTPRFDVASLSTVPDILTTFGQYTDTFNICDGAASRCMQFAFRYEF